MLKRSVHPLPGILLLVGFTFFVYQHVLSNDFVNYDDYRYVLENPFVLAGLSLKSVQWAFTNLEAGFWHPLTWLSHMLDCEIFGIDPTGHHLSSLLLHLANSALLYLLLSRITGYRIRSWLVAALFALHPLHVESVVWVSERKDVLSTLFWILSVWTYASYASGRGRRFYWFSLCLFFLGLMAKSMLVTLPLLLLLLDFWPLRRLFKAPPSRSQVQKQRPITSSMRLVLIEKVPFLLLSLLFTVITWMAEDLLGALPSISPANRAAGMLVGYGSYLVKTIRPANLSAIYLDPGSWPLWQVIGSTMLFLSISAAALLTRKKRPYILVGWLWYLITLLPVSGIVRIGSHAIADRYTYVPLIGIFIIIVWGIRDLLSYRQSGRIRRSIPALLSGSALMVLSVCTMNQIRTWQNSVTLFENAVRATRENYLAHYNLGIVLAQRGRLEQALIHYQEAIRIRPDYPDARSRLAEVLEKLGKTP